MNIGDWLRGLGLERYEQAFIDNDIDAAILPSLTAKDLTGLGVNSIGHRRRLLDAIAACRLAHRREWLRPEASPAEPRRAAL